MSRDLVPVTELPSIDSIDSLEVDAPEQRCLWDFDLPPTLDAERIVVDMGRLKRVQRIGAVISNQIVSYQGDVTTVTPGINGIQDDGTATASSRASVQHAQRSQQLFMPELPCPTHESYGKFFLVNRLNKAEMVSRISDQKRQSNKSREQIWATELNDAFTESFAQGVRPYMVGHSHALRRIFHYGLYGLAAQDLAELGTNGDSAFMLMYLPIWYGLMTGLDSLENKKIYGDALLDRKRWSLFPSGHQTDRYLAVKALLAVAPIVHARA